MNQKTEKTDEKDVTPEPFTLDRPKGQEIEGEIEEAAPVEAPAIPKGILFVGMPVQQINLLINALVQYACPAPNTTMYLAALANLRNPLSPDQVAMKVIGDRE